MILNFPESIRHEMLNVLVKRLERGGSIELVDGEGRLLGALRLPAPAARLLADGSLAFNPIPKSAATADGKAAVARICAADSSEVFSCDVGDEKTTNAVIKFQSCEMRKEGSISLREFRLMLQ